MPSWRVTVALGEPDASLSQPLHDAHRLVSRDDEAVFGFEIAFGQV